MHDQKIREHTMKAQWVWVPVLTARRQKWILWRDGTKTVQVDVDPKLNVLLADVHPKEVALRIFNSTTALDALLRQLYACADIPALPAYLAGRQAEHKSVSARYRRWISSHSAGLGFRLVEEIACTTGQSWGTEAPPGRPGSASAMAATR